jgi:hypothetical protein
MNTSWWLRTLIAFDALLQVMWRGGNCGVTMSSRIGTAAAHGHRWGLAGSWLLDHTAWLGFGPGHCQEAICNDILRARAAIVELTDPTVVAYYARKP